VGASRLRVKPQSLEKVNETTAPAWQPLHATFAHLIQLHEDTSHNPSHYTICTWDKSHSNSARASTYSHLSKCSRHIVCYALRPLQSSSDWFLICKKGTLYNYLITKLKSIMYPWYYVPFCLHIFFFFFRWRYSPLWVLACRTIPLNFSLFITNSLHLLTPST